MHGKRTYVVFGLRALCESEETHYERVHVYAYVYVRDFVYVCVCCCCGCVMCVDGRENR